MKEFIDKLISRLEEIKEKNQPTINGKTTMRDLEVYKMTIGYVKEIVNELAEEYKGGWIPCSERLPEESGEYLTFVDYNDDKFISIDECFCGGMVKEWNCTPNYKVLAWQPLPAPYTKGD